jgi:glycerol-3-phosphate dehydrogenase
MDSIKFYTRAQMGRCQGGFCSYKIMKILMRETGMSIEEITKRGGESRLITERVGALTVRPPAPPAKKQSGRGRSTGEADQ